MGVLTKVYLKVSDKFWDNKERYILPSNSSGYNCDADPLVYSLDGKSGLEGSAMVAIALTGERGKEAANVGASDDRDTRKWVCIKFLPVFNNNFNQDIQQTYGRQELDCGDIVEIFIPTWSNDPLSLGCWVIYPLGSVDKKIDYKVMGNMILLGEATCNRHVGWVPSGWFSGEKSVRLILKEQTEGFEDLDTRTFCNFKAKTNFYFNEETSKFNLK